MSQGYCRTCLDMKEGQSRGKQFCCKTCGTFTLKPRTDFSPNRSRQSRVLLIDIETAPREVYEWRPNQEWTPPVMVKKEESILCYGAKWLFGDEIFGGVVTPKEATNRTQDSILGGMWSLLDQAQVVVTQNGIDFDIKKMNAQFLKAGFPPPSRYLNVDTKREGKRIFGFPYNSLDYYGKAVLGIEGKIEMEFEDWIGCIEPSKLQKEFLEKMFTYCKNDVAPLLEDIYLKFLPWMENHPNLAVFGYHEGDCCPKCESNKLLWSLEYPTPQGLWNGFRCDTCGAIGRGKGKSNRLSGSNIQ